jgi:hypothetical protein
MRSFGIYFDLSIGTGGGMKHRAVGIINVVASRDDAMMMIAWTMDNRLSRKR